MDWTKQICAMIVVLLVGHSVLFAQQMELGVAAYPGLAHNQAFEPGMNGWSIDLAYLHEVFEDRALRAGLELGYSGWGSQSLIVLGYRHGRKHMLDVEVINGMALYQQGSQYVGGLGAYYAHRFFKGKNGLLLSAGLRYTVQPAYRNHSPIFHYIDLPIRIRWSRKPAPPN